MHMATSTDIVVLWWSSLAVCNSLQQFATVCNISGLVLSWCLQALDLESEPPAEAVGLNKVLLGWVAMNNDILKSNSDMLPSIISPSFQLNRTNGKLEPPWNAVKCNMVQVKYWDSECKQSSSFAFFLQVEVENTPGNVEVAAAQARAVALNKVSASISQSCVAKLGVESE